MADWLLQLDRTNPVTTPDPSTTEPNHIATGSLRQMPCCLPSPPLAALTRAIGITTGRRCEGYEPQPEAKPIRFVTLMHVTYPPNELRSFQYFQERTLSQLFTFIQEDIWTSHIVQTANMHQGIWHSVVAFSSFHENFARHGYTGPDNHDRFALKQYNMSIQSILGSERNSSNAHVHLISCILFICIEVGYAILKEERARSCCPYTESSGPSSRDRDQLFASADIFLSRIATQAFLLVKGIDPSLATVVAEILDFDQFAWKARPTFHTLNQVQHALSTLRLELETYNQVGVGIVPVKFRWWRSAYNEFKKEHAEQLTSHEGKRGIALLDLQGLYVGVETAVLDGPPGAEEDPLRWDAHTDDFREMLNHAEAATDLDQEDGSNSLQGPQFHMHIGVVPILYGIIHKCRDPAIRRRAIALMRRSQRLEGVWDSQVVLSVALRAMDVEEQGRALASSAEIPAAARIRRIAVLPVRQGEYNNANPKSYMVGYQIDQKWAWEQADNFLPTSSSSEQ
ncbi:hypothetical protein CCM_05846 [Cordyceps militaris CM01]|uniref:C6 zinc finger domain protein n=1 Tax=Cordyceps militaris (strain CM01) TaxID=983644 RepID=G3JHD2_CORMM|nr:uncharacterized protein CCM_05846 [Cordyceps militaris CM01]EGX91688.1 hypothetical protein CCM_05846 [Cordyceps militaris CM01]